MPIKEYFARKAARKARMVEKSNLLWKSRPARTSEAARGIKKHQPEPKSLLCKQLDHLCKLLVFRRDRKIYAGYCLICIVKREMGLAKYPPRPISTPYHVLPRGDKAVRWDLRNIIGSCAPCNFGELKSRASSALKARMRAIHSLIVGEPVLLELEALAKTTTHFSTADLISMREKLNEMLGVKS